MSRSLFATLAAAAGLMLAGSAHGAVLLYKAALSGPAESPPNASPATGMAVVSIDDVSNLMTVDVSFSGLLGTTTASHIHCCTTVPDTGTAPVATTTPSFAGFPIGVMGGTYHRVLDLTLASSYNPAFVTAHGGTTTSAEQDLLAGIAAGESYLNIHSSFAPGGEIRGFLAAAVPEPATWGILLLGFGLAGAALRRRGRALAA